MRYHERIVMLSVLDGLWKDHLLSMDHLKEGIGLRGYAQQDPLVAYKKESFEMFEAMMLRFQEDTARLLFRMQIIGPDGNPIETPDQLPRPTAAPELVGQSSSQPSLSCRLQLAPKRLRSSTHRSPSQPAPRRPPSTLSSASSRRRSSANSSKPAPPVPAPQATATPPASPEKK